MFATFPIKEKRRIRGAIVWGLAGVCLVAGLSQYKKVATEKFSHDTLEILKVQHPKVVHLFQASFYFFFEERFLPGVKQWLSPSSSLSLFSASEGPGISRMVILSHSGGVIFDTDSPKKEESSPLFSEVDVLSRLKSGGESVFFRNFKLRVLVPSGDYHVLYVVDAEWIRNRIGIALVLVALLGFLLWRVVSLDVLRRTFTGTRKLWARFWRLRVKFLVTIVLINFLTGAIVFYTLSSMQTKEQTERIERESILFSQFSTSRVISDFTNFFYFYYLERFLPEIKATIASNETLVGIRIVSRRNNNILFDSDDASVGPTGTGGAGSLLRQETPVELRKANFSEDIEEQLKTRDLATRFLYRDGEKLLSVVTTYRNESQPLFWVEYLFSFQTLAKSISAIRRQILLDLIPSLGLSLLIAAFFSQLLISPIRRLVGALKLVSSGDFNVSVDVSNQDEIGDLAAAFNTMTNELKKKKELRKYLSDSTYRQVMRAAEGEEGLRIGGRRVSATVLFTDIRNFVAHCETMDAEEVTGMLNEYFAEMVEVVYKYGGEVDKFIGDAFLAVFYANDEGQFMRPQEQCPGVTSSATALQSVYCALEMRERLAEFNERRVASNKSPIETGVGITFGEIISGPIGAKDRMDFTVIGDVVNLAARIEKLSKNGKFSKIVFSAPVEEKIRGLLDYVELSREKVRGKQEDVIIYELVGIRQLETLIGNLQSSDKALRRRSVELLGQSRNLSALPCVLEAMGDDDEATQILAIMAVSKLAPKDDPEVIATLLERIGREKSEKILPSLVTVFGRVCTTQKIFALVPFLDSPNERIVANVVEALGQVRNPRATDLLLPKLYSRNNRIKANAAMALFASGHIEVIDTLKPMLMHSDPLMRSSAAFAIGELTLIAEYSTLLKSWNSDDQDERQATKVFLAELQECVPMLVALLKDRDVSVRRQAVIALGKIKDKSSVLPLIDLVNPEVNSKELSRDIQEALRSIGSHKVVREVISRLV